MLVPLRYRLQSALWLSDSALADSPHTLTAEDYSPDGRHFNMQSFFLNGTQAEASNDLLVPYVFPACGHVYGYHASLMNKPCPLCRKLGAFVPVRLMYRTDSLLSSGNNPDCVFNPCGHVAERALCVQSASLKVRLMNNAGEDVYLPHERAKCPFCTQ